MKSMRRQVVNGSQVFRDIGTRSGLQVSSTVDQKLKDQLANHHNLFFAGRVHLLRRDFPIQERKGTTQSTK